MYEEFFYRNIEFLKGVGPAKAEIFLREVNIRYFGDLLNYFPFRYIDRNNNRKIAEIKDINSYVAIKGHIINTSEKGIGKQRRFIATLKDETGSIELIWFSGLKWIEDKLYVGVQVAAFGKPSIFNKNFNLTHPEIEINPPHSPVTTESYGLQPIYPLTEKMKNRGLNIRAMAAISKNLILLSKDNIPEILPKDIIEKYKFPSREYSYIQIHHPNSLEDMNRAKLRLKFEELFLLQIQIVRAKLNYKKNTCFIFKKIGDYFTLFYNNCLKFELTSAQKKVIKEIRADLKTGLQMNRLLQGDVGSGKTIVALMSTLIALDNNYQACLMTPTEILTKQHFNSFQKLLSQLNISVGLLIGSTPKKEKREILEKTKSGEIQILIGTHALLEDSVEFKNLGLVIIDEQHRFGVAQRAKLWKKNNINPHILVMTATPIPRTLGMTLYGDLDISIINELPPGRKPIKTLHFTDRSRLKVFEFIKTEIDKDRQIYIVYPLINESEKLDLKDLNDGFEGVSRAFPLPKYAVSIVHGKMKSDIKEYEMQRFIKGETQIMVSTTVIEVGVDVPNASVMIIENSERFGLAQLHQLRGRVGRGAEQSYCILMTGDRNTEESKFRINTMLSSNDGFEIAEADLRLRGPGNIQGTQQSGSLEFKIANLIEDEHILKAARDSAINILQEDPNLILEKNLPLSIELKSQKREDFWGKIS